MGVGGLGLDRAGLAGLEAFELLVEVVDLDAADAAGAGDDLGVVLVGDDVAVDLHVHVGQ